LGFGQLDLQVVHSHNDGAGIQQNDGAEVAVVFVLHFEGVVALGEQHFDEGSVVMIDLVLGHAF